MAWIESHQELARHPKAKRFARLLGVTLPAAIGHLHFFWWWAMDYAQDGDISKYEKEDIADASHWEGDPETLYSALLGSKFIDEDGFIHDWFDYAGRLVEKREQNKERKRRSRANKKDGQSSHAPVTRDVPVTDESVTGLPNPTQPNPTEPYPTKPNQPEIGGGDLNPYRIFEQEGFGTISPVIQDQIDDLIVDYGIHWYKEAMKIAVLNGKRTLRYVNGILMKWKANGIDEPWKEEKQGAESEGRTKGIRHRGNQKESEFAFLDQQNRTGTGS
ncbi:DnaD domain protein [Neobacillus mesonae]|nr:DnaD domain protein [Neobacillus mesonae]